jgi:hypothetical protein
MKDMSRYIKQIFLLLLLLPPLSSCGVFQIATTENFKKTLNSDIGKPIEDIVNRRGQADQLSETPNGNKIFIYSFSNTYSSPVSCRQNSDGGSNCTGGVLNTSWCKIFYEVDKNNVVASYTLKGNACKSCSDTLYCKFL